METNKRLYRSAQHKVFGGVSGGLGEYFDLDPIIIRILFVLLLLGGGAGFFIYVILWIAIPQKPANLANVTSDAKVVANDAGEPAQRTKQRSNLVLGVILIALGILFFAHHLIPRFNIDTLWPLIFIFLGGLLIYSNYNKTKTQKNDEVTPFVINKEYNDTPQTEQKPTLPKHEEDDIIRYDKE